LFSLILRHIRLKAGVTTETRSAHLDLAGNCGKFGCRQGVADGAILVYAPFAATMSAATCRPQAGNRRGIPAPNARNISSL